MPLNVNPNHASARIHLVFALWKLGKWGPATEEIVRQAEQANRRFRDQWGQQ